MPLPLQGVPTFTIPPAVILAAGDGGRMGEHTAHLPKPLVLLHGRPIIHYTLNALRQAGVSSITIVTGYLEQQVREALAGEPVTFATNPRYHDGASYSLQAARIATGNAPFLLVMADHVLSAPLIERLLAAAAGNPARCYVAADTRFRDPAFAAEATHLALGPGAPAPVTAIGKRLPHPDALDAGAFYLTPAIWEAAADAPPDCELSAIMEKLIDRGLLFAADVTGARWYDIDTDEDLRAAALEVLPE